MGGAEESWADVDRWFESALLGPDPALDEALRRNAAAGLPPIDVSPLQGRLLELLATIGGARRILELGTLGGYSTICLARGAGGQGRVLTLEYAPHHAEVARRNIDAAGVGDRVEIRVGPALDSLDAMIAAGEAAFDLIFVDADKANSALYLERAMRLSRPGTVLLFDNVVREGRVIDPTTGDTALEGIRDMVAAVSGLRLRATAIQTVGAKGWDGFLLARVEADA